MIEYVVVQENLCVTRRSTHKIGRQWSERVLLAKVRRIYIYQDASREQGGGFNSHGMVLC